MASEEFKHVEMGRLPPIIPRYNSYLLDSLDDIIIDESHESNQLRIVHELNQLLPDEEIVEEISISSEFFAEASPRDNLLSNSIKNDTWNCPICLDIFEDPVETPCCHNLFCERCIQLVLKCPICKKLLVHCLPNIPIKRLVQELSVKCRHPLCDKIVKKALLNKHESHCEMAQVKCTYSASCGEIIRKDLISHITEHCQYRPIACSLQCGTEMAFIKLADHLVSNCPNALLACSQGCGVSLLRKDSAHHFTQICPNTPVTCPLADYFGAVCGAPCLRRELQEHQLTCGFREVKCSNAGCKEKIIYQYLQSHEDACKYKIISCPNCCEAEFIRKELEEHLNACDLQFIECKFNCVGCAHVMQRKKLPGHLESFSQEHQLQMLNALTDFQEKQNRCEHEFNEFTIYVKKEIEQLGGGLRRQYECTDPSADEEIPNPFSEILKLQ